MGNPLDLVYSWQALLVAVVANALTQLVKTLIDIYRGHAAESPTPTVKDMVRVGAGLRRSSLIINRVVVPGLSLVFGALTAMIIPVRPEALIAYCAAQSVSTTGSLAIFGAWGAACGQFASYTFDRVKEVISHQQGA